MSEPSAYEELEALLRELVSLWANGASLATIEATTEAALDLWKELPPMPAGVKVQWPDDIAAIATELGFDTVAGAPSPPIRLA